LLSNDRDSINLKYGNRCGVMDMYHLVGYIVLSANAKE
jgi:hypothetical protein